MRILGIHSHAEVRGGADGVYIYGNQLLHDRGHELAWMHVGSASIADSLGNPVFSLPNTSSSKISRQVSTVKGLLYSKEAVRIAEQAVKDFQPNVVHAHNIRGSFSPAIFQVFQKKGIPVVQTLHDYRLVCPVNSFLSRGRVCESCKGQRYYWCTINRCSNGGFVPSLILSLSGYVADYGYHYDQLIHRYIAPSEFLRQKLIEFGYSPMKLVTLNNAYFSIRPAHSSDQRNNILFAGRLTHEKGVDLLIRASVGISEPVLIAGDGPARKDLEALANEVQATQVRFLGFQPHEKMQELIAHAKVLVLPSRWYENGPLVILESYANGTPVIGANIGAIPEFIEEGKTGYLFKADDAASLHQVLQRALTETEALRTIGSYAQKLVEERFSPDLYAEKLERILESVL